MSSVRFTSDSLVSATLPTQTAAWHMGGWVQIRTGGYNPAGDSAIVAFGTSGGSSQGFQLNVGAGGTVLNAGIFRNAGANFDFQAVLTGSNTAWLAWVLQYSGSGTAYTFRYRLENATTWSSLTLDCGAALTAGGSLYIGCDQFTTPDEFILDGNVKGFWCQSNTITDAAAFTASIKAKQGIAPAGTNLHWLDLDSATNVGVNGGTAGNWTTGGAPATDASEPVETFVVVAQSDQATATGTGTSLAKIYPSAVTPGSTLNCFVKYLNVTSETVSVADNVNGSWGAAVQSVDDGTNTIAEFRFANTAAGTPTVTATFGITTTLRGLAIQEIVNAKTSSPLDGFAGQSQANPGAGTDAITTGTVANSAQPALILAISFDDRAVSPVAPAAGTGFTDLGALWTFAGGNQARLESKRITTTTAVAATFTGTAGVAPTTLMAIFDEVGATGNPPKTDQVPLDSPISAPRPRTPVARRHEVVAPVGTLMVAGLSSLGWNQAPVLPAPPRLARGRDAQSVQPIGSRMLSSIGWLATDLPRATPIVARRVADSSPVGTIVQATLTSLGWLVVGTSSPPPTPRLVYSDLGLSTAQPPTLTVLAWADASTPARAPVLGRQPVPVGWEPPLVPFVSPSTAWQSFPQFGSRAPSLKPSRADVSSPVGTLLAAQSTSLGWMGADQQRSTVPASHAQDPQGPLAPLQPFVSASTGWFDSSKPASSAIAARPTSTIDPVGSPLTSQLSSLGWAVAHPPAVQKSTRWPLDVQQPLNAVMFGGAPWATTASTPAVIRPAATVSPSQPDAPLQPFVSPSMGWLTAEPPRPVAAAPSRPQPSEPLTALTYLSASTGWLNVSDPPRRLAAVRRVGDVQPVGTQFAPFLPGIGWLATDNPRTPYRSQPAVPVDPVGNLLAVASLPGQSWLYATPDPRTPYRSQRAVVVDPVGTAFPFLPAFGAHWYAESRRPAVVPTTAPRPFDPLTTLSQLTALGWMVADGRAPSRPPVAVPQPTDAHLSALQFGGAPWADVPLARPVPQNRPVLASVAPLAPLAPPSFGWHTIELRARAPRIPFQPSSVDPLGSVATPTITSFGWHVVESRAVRPAAAGRSLPVDPLSPLGQLSSLGWLVVDPSGQRVAPSVRPLASNPLSALAPSFSFFPWVALEPRRSSSVAQSVANVRGNAPIQPVGTFMPPPVLPTLSWLTTELPVRYPPRITRPEPSVVYGAVSIAVIPPLVPDGESFTWHVPDESLVSVVQFDFRRRR